MAEQRTKRPRGPMGGPGRGMMPGEKPKDFKTLSKTGSLSRKILVCNRCRYDFAAVSTVFSVAGPKVMARATNALVEGLGKRSREPDLLIYLYCQSVIVYTWPVYLFCSIQFYTGNDHDRNHAENLLPHA